MFSAGCGRLFEGSPAQMLETLAAINRLPSQTQICCAHEYTLTNLRFAASVYPSNSAVFEHLEQCQQCSLRPCPGQTTSKERAYSTARGSGCSGSAVGSGEQPPRKFSHSTFSCWTDWTGWTKLLPQHLFTSSISSACWTDWTDSFKTSSNQPIRTASNTKSVATLTAKFRQIYRGPSC